MPCLARFPDSPLDSDSAVGHRRNGYGFLFPRGGLRGPDLRVDHVSVGLAPGGRGSLLRHRLRGP